MYYRRTNKGVRYSSRSAELRGRSNDQRSWPFVIPAKAGIQIQDLAPLPDECFAERAAKWVYIMAFIVALLFVIGLHRFFLQLRRQPRHGQAWTDAAAWSTAYNPGTVEVHTPYQSMGQAGQALLIPELALEAANAPDGQGVVASVVYAGGPAEAAGLQPFDQIVKFNGRKVRNPRQFQDLISRAQPETEVKIVFLRGGVPMETLLRVGEGEFKPVASTF
ncbi:MAG: PDZ domain-containing protein [Elusimicrobia bacterium]|nr:PDZ domain-containing protein [Elusimicrobiota bacterium]